MWSLLDPALYVGSGLHYRDSAQAYDMFPVTCPGQHVLHYRQSTVCGCLHWAWEEPNWAPRPTNTSTGPRVRSTKVPRHPEIHPNLCPSVGCLFGPVTERGSVEVGKMRLVDFQWERSACWSGFREESGCSPHPRQHLVCPRFCPDLGRTEQTEARQVGPPKHRGVYSKSPRKGKCQSGSQERRGNCPHPKAKQLSHQNPLSFSRPMKYENW